MILRAYSIFDTKALQYHPPFFQATDGAAVRLLQDLVSDLNTTVGRHPNDFVLYCIGTYDDSEGLLSPALPRLHVMDAVALVKVQIPLPGMGSQIVTNATEAAHLLNANGAAK